MSDGQTGTPPVPPSRAVPRHQTRISLVWVFPLVAALIGVWVAVARIRSEGPKITIVFSSADGLEAGKTKIRYKGVDVGTLTTIRLSDDHLRVIARAQMAPGTAGFLVRDTRLWVVRPRVSGATITGLGTLISGAFIGMDIGSSQEPRSEFVALDTPPVVSTDVPGRFFILQTSDLGSIDIGTPVFFRRLEVGKVVSYRLRPDGHYFTVRIFVQTPYARYVTTNTRFWQASGVDLQLSANGLTVQTQSLLSIMVGGVAFATPETPTAPVAPDNATYVLYTSRSEAFEPPPLHPQIYQLIFKSSVRGLYKGAPVEFRGIKIGQVTDVRAQIDAKTMWFSAPVTIELDPQRLGVQLVGVKSDTELQVLRRKLIDTLVAQGVRAQLKTDNLLTGAAYVSFDFFPDSPPATVDWSRTPVELPTTSGEFQTAEASIEDIIKKIDKMPLDKISDQLRRDLADLDQALVSARGTLATANGTLTTARGTLVSARTAMDSANAFIEPDSAQNQALDNMILELTRAARSMRVLADYLERHPEALVRGKTGGAH